MAVTAMSFRWLDLLEKEFDKAYVDLDILIGELDSDEPEMVYAARQKMSTLSSCFAQLTHKAQTIFQNNAKVEMESSRERHIQIKAYFQRGVTDMVYCSAKPALSSYS
ncbi:Golgi-associated PDZ and coiled-coil motif-containing protein-like [Halyomorpha halys]|uniref:Golgi-associated PDZ and coiled-coil motif-containing protein-like n=1 Tax=Halyomorpha halys TaxID=286706 RepID=UPI0034D30691